MRGLSKRELAVFTAMSGIAGMAVFGSCPARAGENGPQTRPSGVVVRNADGTIELRADSIRLQVDEGPGGFPYPLRAEGNVIIRVADDSPAPGSSAGDNDIIRRLRERRAKEAGGAGNEPAQSDVTGRLQMRRAQEEETRAVRIQTEAKPENPAGGPRGLAETSAIVAPAKKEKVTFLGVGASPAPAVLTHQLHLPADFGLVVDEVVPEGPAGKAGLKQFDLLQKLDDQLLVDDQQLTALVRSHKPGETVMLTVIREGKPLMLKATLAEHGEAAEGEGQRFTVHFDQPIGLSGDPAENKPVFRLAPGLAGPNGPNVPPRLERPLPPAAVVVPPRQVRPPEAPRSNGSQPAPQALPAAPAAPADANGEEARRLEQELRSLRETAEQLRAQIEARKKQEADEQKGNGPADKDQKDGEKP